MNAGNVFKLFLMATIGQFAIASGSYEVPASAELAAHAKWERIEASAEISDGELKIRYCLPSDLVGKRLHQIVAMGQVDGKFVAVSGKHVSGYCMISLGKPLTCILRYPKMPIDVVSRDESLRQNFTGVDFESRSLVAKVFGADPAGLLSVELK